jgi:hypothetical protein
VCAADPVLSGVKQETVSVNVWEYDALGASGSVQWGKVALKVADTVRGVSVIGGL